MKCSHCGFEGDEKYFTASNRSHGGEVGRCKACKAIVDAKYRQKRDQAAMKRFDLIPDMLNKRKARIGVLMLSRITDRYFGQGKTGFFLEPNLGLKAVVSELEEPYEICYPETINDYEIVLVSLTSVMDVENLIYTFEKYAPKTITARIITGGFGCLNIKLIKDYIDVAVFGRAEGQIKAIISGLRFKNTWDKATDPDISGTYEVRQPQYLVKGERGVGCLNRCSYCQYTHTRHPIGRAKKYDPGMATQETDFHSLVVDRPGVYVTAWDGFSEVTRLAVKKNIKNSDIINKLVSIGNMGFEKQVFIKIFQIVGYPWETPETVLTDIQSTIYILKEIESKIKSKITIGFMVTPFGPEPLTPMQYEPGNIHTNWNQVLAGKKLYYGERIKAFIYTSVSGPFALLKRMMINRAESTDADLFKKIVFSSKLNRLQERFKVPWLIKNKIIRPELFGRVTSGAFDFLKIPQTGGGSFLHGA
jgi:hypothetical protein